MVEVPSEFTIEFDSINRVLKLTFSDATTKDESVVKAHEAMRRFMRDNGGPCHLVRDYRISGPLSSRASVQRLGTLPRLLPVGWKHVIIVARAVQYGIARQVQMLRAREDGDQYHIVTSDQEAWQALEITSPQLQPIDL